MKRTCSSYRAIASSSCVPAQRLQSCEMMAPSACLQTPHVHLCQGGAASSSMKRMCSAYRAIASSCSTSQRSGFNRASGGLAPAAWLIQYARSRLHSEQSRWGSVGCSGPRSAASTACALGVLDPCTASHSAWASCRRATGRIASPPGRCAAAVSGHAALLAPVAAGNRRIAGPPLRSQSRPTRCAEPRIGQSEARAAPRCPARTGPAARPQTGLQEPVHILSIHCKRWSHW